MLGYVIVYASQTKLSIEGEMVTFKTLYNDVEIKKFSPKKIKCKVVCIQVIVFKIKKNCMIR